MAKGKFTAIDITTPMRGPETRALIELMEFGDVTVRRAEDGQWECEGSNGTAIEDDLDGAIFTCLRMHTNPEEFEY